MYMVRLQELRKGLICKKMQSFDSCMYKFVSSPRDRRQSSQLVIWKLSSQPNHKRPTNLYASYRTRRCLSTSTELPDAHAQAIQFSPRPSLSRARGPCSCHSSREIQNSSRFFIISASTAPPRKTICFRRGGSSIRILNLCL